MQKTGNGFVKSLMNNLASIGLLINWLLVPSFWYQVHQARKKRQAWTKLVLIECENLLQGFSCAEIEAVLWQYGVPTHFVFFSSSEKKIKWSFFIPAYQHFWADTILRQHQKKMGFIILSTPVRGSNKYQHKEYKAWGVVVKPKSWLAGFAMKCLPEFQLKTRKRKNAQ